jgi:hypothetical protein
VLARVEELFVIGYWNRLAVFGAGWLCSIGWLCSVVVGRLQWCARENLPQALQQPITNNKQPITCPDRTTDF